MTQSTKQSDRIQRDKSNRWFEGLAALVITGLFAAVLFSGCNRRTYRLWADDDAYSLIKSRQNEPDWIIPDRAIEPAANSRLADDQSLDCGPSPPDDPSANCWLRNPYRFKNGRYWDQIGQLDSVENQNWEMELPVDENNEINIDRVKAIELALLHSREYQGEVEGLYLAALGLSANRFEFDTQWFGRTGSSYAGNGRNDFANRSIAQSSAFGFSKSLAAGGQLAVSLANSLVWNLTPSGPTTTSSSIVMSLTQPLLRGAFRHVRLESLSQAERNLLYNVRLFARFRRQFYLGVTGRYLGLLAQTQALRNQRANLKSLELSLREFEELYDKGDVSQISVDQVFQDYQRGRISLLAAEQGYANSLDDFKLQLGLPPRVNIKIDEEFLKPFELSNPKFDELRSRTDEIYQALVQFLPPEVPPQDLLDRSFTAYVDLQSELKELLPELQDELETWRTRLDKREPERLTPEDRVDYQQQVNLLENIELQLEDVAKELEKDFANIDKTEQQFRDLAPDEAWKNVSDLLGVRLRSQHSTMFLMQNQIRLFLIDVTPFELDEPAALDMALANRVDLMNQRGITMDAWRGVEIAADALQSNLDVTADVSVGTDPAIQNPVRFDSSASAVQLGVQFDGPLNRFNERNAFRSAQIFYQQARRQYMSSEDNIVTGIRANLRSLRISWLNFQISRQQLIAATRQVDEAQFQLRAQTSADTSATRDLLQALQGLLSAKNNLISSWIDYEVGRIGLFVDLELLYLDQNGTWINETFNPGLSDASPNRNSDATLPGTNPPKSNDSESTESRFDDSGADAPSLDPPGSGPSSDGEFSESLKDYYRK